MSAITAKASRKMKKYAVLTREPRCFLGSFDFSWEQRKLGEIGSVSMCRRIFKEQTSETGDIPFYKIGTFGADPDAFISRELFEEYKSKYPYPQKGDILISASGSIGRTVEFAGNNEYFQDSNIVWLNHDERLSNPFLKCFYSVVKWAGIEGSTIKRLYNDNILNTVICMPSVPEQKRIGLFFENLDNLITLHQRECISFTARAGRLILTANKKRNTSSWEQRKLGELVDRVVRKNTNNESTLPLTISAQYGLVDQITYFNNRVASRDVSNYYLVLNGEFAYNKSTSDGYPFGAVKRLDLYEKGVLSTLYIVFAPKKEQQIDSDYLTVFFDTDRWHKGVAERAAEGARNHGLLNISAEDFFDIDLSVPKDIVEQKQIGAFIRQLDSLITLHQRQPFSHSTPDISLSVQLIHPFYTSSWEQRKFDEVFDCTVPNNTLSRAELSYDEGTVLNVHYGDVLIKYGSVLDVQKDDIPRIPHRCREDFNGALLKDGDVIIADTAEDETTGKACEIGNLQGSAIVSGLHTMVCRPRNRMALGYLGYYLNSTAYHHQLLPLMQGIKVLSLSRSNIQKTSVSYPIAVKEQQLIAYYFSQLDNLITLPQRKGKAAVSGCSNDANNSKGVCCKARDFGYKCHKKDESK